MTKETNNEVMLTLCGDCVFFNNSRNSTCIKTNLPTARYDFGFDWNKR